MNEGKDVISIYLRNEIIAYFYQGHTCKETDDGFCLKPGTTHDIIVARWKFLKENSEKRKRKKEAK